jgi:hypothetical protein
MIINTNWSTPKRNVVAATLDLRTALLMGYNAKLIKLRNEDCNYPIKHIIGQEEIIKTFKRNLWVVQLLNNNQPKPKTPLLVYILNWIIYPMKFIPKKSVLNMKNYKKITFSIGSVMNGFSVEFNIPKKFSFK